MALLVALLACATPCEPVAVGCFEYAPEACAVDLFYPWRAVPLGSTPAFCDASGADCLPTAWSDCVLVRRPLEECKC